MIVKLQKIRVLGRIAIIWSVFSTVFLSLAIGHSSFATCTVTDGNTVCSDFNVQVNEVLTVAITRPNVWANGTINTLLTNKVGISVASNNSAGFTATMRSASTTPNLVNQYDSTATIPTLSAETTVAEFNANKWGYSIVESGGEAPTSYFGMVGSGDLPIVVVSNNGLGTATADIYFAAKADGSMPSGTYANSVIVSVVSGVVTDSGDDPNDNPITPTSPVSPVDDTANDGSSTETSHGNSPTGTSVVTVSTSSNSDSTTTTTESYAKPHGVTERVTTFTTDEGNSLNAGFAITAGISAVASVALFALAKYHGRSEYDGDDSGDY